MGSRLARRGYVAVPVILAASMVGSPAPAHDWYPIDCCSGHDCYPVGVDDIEVLPDGWRILRTGEVVPFGQTSKRPWERESMDGQFHRCSKGGDPDAETLCLFVPAMGS